jgi:hypothetical protein
MIADELRRQADNFIELDELKEVIGRPPRPPREPQMPVQTQAGGGDSDTDAA